MPYSRHLGLIGAVGEVPHIVVDGMGAHALRRVHLDDLAVPHDGHGIPQLKRLVHIVGNENDRFLELALNLKQLKLHIPPHQGV